jgi:transcriptional regulator of acetoin/glycerol metabolism
MKQPRFHISLYIIIPFIFAGFSIFSALMAFRLTKYGLENRADPSTWVFWLIACTSVLAFAAGFALVRFILRPVEQFVEKASQMPAFSGASPSKSAKDWSVDKLAQFTSVFDRVTSVLSRIDARHFFPEIIGESLAMRGLLSLIMKVAPTDSTVLLIGESGTGKELVATSIFEHSQRKEKPFVKLNCAAIPEELLESELFGHEKGAFTGATAFKPGKFDMANKGTLFLDEIGDMPMSLQAKILRALRRKNFIGSGAARRSRWTSASSPRPIKTSKKWSRTAASGKICSTG